MSDRHIVVVDAGTTRIRCLVFNSKGEAVVERSAAWSYVESGELSPYARELNAIGVWESTARLIAECVGDGRVEAGQVEAVTVTSQRQGVVFLDRDGGILYAGPNTDLRAVFGGAAIDEAMGGRVFEVTGRLPVLLVRGGQASMVQAAQTGWIRQDRAGGHAGGLASVETVGRACQRDNAGGRGGAAQHPRTALVCGAVRGTGRPGGCWCSHREGGNSDWERSARSRGRHRGLE